MQLALVLQTRFIYLTFFILLGRPVVEATRHDVKFTALLADITVAVVGVILYLAGLFAYNVFCPRSFN